MLEPPQLGPWTTQVKFFTSSVRTPDPLRVESNDEIGRKSFLFAPSPAREQVLHQNLILWTGFCSILSQTGFCPICVRLASYVLDSSVAGFDPLSLKFFLPLQFIFDKSISGEGVAA